MGETCCMHTRIQVKYEGTLSNGLFFFNIIRISLEIILYRIGVLIAIKLLRVRVCTNCVMQEKVQGRLDSNPDFK